MSLERIIATPWLEQAWVVMMWYWELGAGILVSQVSVMIAA